MVNKDKELRKNASGYSDPTAYKAIRNSEEDDEKFKKVLHTIFNVCELSNFKIEGRIVLKDEETGKIYR